MTVSAPWPRLDVARVWHDAAAFPQDLASCSQSQQGLCAVRSALGLTCEAPSLGVCWRLPLMAAIVTHLGTRPRLHLVRLGGLLPKRNDRRYYFGQVTRRGTSLIRDTVIRPRTLPT